MEPSPHRLTRNTPQTIEKAQLNIPEQHKNDSKKGGDSTLRRIYSLLDYIAFICIGLLSIKQYIELWDS